MNVSAYLTKQQPLLLKQFSSALLRQHLSHAYLLSGEAGAPLLEIAKYLAKSIVCENATPLADETCMHCLRIDDGNYADIQIFDGGNATIKKEEIQQLETSFERTPVEKAGKLIYILHLVENLTVEAINSLLKFLEEPHQEVYAFLTTENENKVLETIISRSQRLRVLPINRSLIIKDALDDGIPANDAELLSFFYHDLNIMKNVINEDYYISIRDAMIEFFKQLNEDVNEAKLIFLERFSDAFFQKDQLRFLIDVFVLMITDIHRYQNGQMRQLPSYAKILKPLTECFPPLAEVLHQLMLLRGQIELNVNPALLLDHVLSLLTKEFIHVK